MSDYNRQIRWWALLVVTAIALYLCWLMIKPFLGVLMWAGRAGYCFLSHSPAPGPIHEKTFAQRIAVLRSCHPDDPRACIVSHSCGLE